MIPKEPIFSLDWAPDAIIVTGHDRTIVHANPRAEGLFGYRKDELADRPLELLIPEGLPSAVEEAPLQHASRMVVCAHRDGTRFPGAARWRPAPPPAGDLLIFAVRENPGAVAPPIRQGADGAPAELLALFTHDVRQSLQAVQLLVDSIRNQVPETAGTISEILGSIGRLLDRLTRIGNPEAIKPMPEPCRLHEVLATLGRELLPLAERKGLRLVIEESTTEVTTDPVLFRELLHNLLANAIRYTETGHVEVRCRSSEHVVRIEVVDTGSGIDGERLDAILRRTAAEPEYRGSGLGLVIVQRLARVLGCTLEVDSALGRGSCFSVIVPRSAEATDRRPPRRRSADRLRGREDG